MHEVLQIVLRPLSWLYAATMWVRNRLYDEHVLHSHSVAVPTICVGNLAVGGTGKTPHVEYLIRLLSKDYHVAVLSRGYGRKTKGFYMATPTSTAAEIGDEPWQISHKFLNVPVAVCAHRVHGIKHLLHLHPEVQVVLLDDAYQHRSLRCGLYVLLTCYDNLYAKDAYLPVGRLRDNREQASRANIVVVTRCPKTMMPIDKRVVDNTLRLSSWQELCFSRVVYPALPKQQSALLVTAIAHPEYVERQLKETVTDLRVMSFIDHHWFNPADMQRIEAEAAQVDCVWTTEKDEARLRMMPMSEALQSKLRVLPIEIVIDDHDTFDRQVMMYVRENSKHSKK